MDDWTRRAKELIETADDIAIGTDQRFWFPPMFDLAKAAALCLVSIAHSLDRIDQNIDKGKR
jgi:hypothetical protein